MRRVSQESFTQLVCRHAIVLSFVSFILHLIWEYAQCSLFFIHKDLAPTHRVMIRAAGGDLLITWVAQGFVSISSRHWLWCLRSWSMREWTILVLFSLLVGTGIELNALHSQQWSYTEINPRIPGLKVSIIPIFQLLLLLPLSFGIARYSFRLKGSLET